MRRFLAPFSTLFDAVLTENGIRGGEPGYRIEETVAADARAMRAVCAVLGEHIS